MVTTKPRLTKAQREERTETVLRIDAVFNKRRKDEGGELFVTVANGIERWAKYAATYEEIHVMSGTMPAFPAACPVCGQSATMIKLCYGREVGELKIVGDEGYAPFAIFKCGGAFTKKDQIQNHTDKWWGHCAAAALWVKSVVEGAGLS